jgi:hypothetical protein
MIHAATQAIGLSEVLQWELASTRLLRNGNLVQLFSRDGEYQYVILEAEYNRAVDMRIAVRGEPLTEEEREELGW